MRALVGHTGFVGSNLQRQRPFDALFNSKNIAEISGRTFDEVVCAAAPAEKWKANKDPVADREAIERLTSALSTVRASRLILISTIDVYPTPRNVDERTPIDPALAAPYGKHRLLLEQFARDRFAATIIRLPALFGQGLKKNAVFDLLHDNDVHKIDGRGVFQFYNLEHLTADMDRALAAGIGLLNVATEPVSVREIAGRFFARELRDGESPLAPCYDFRSVHASVWDGSDGYLYTQATVMGELEDFIGRARGSAFPKP